MKNDCDFLLKIVVIGDLAVGKSCLVLRFADNVFKNHYPFTVGIDLRIKTIIQNGQRIKLQIWDTAGNERFKSISTNFYRGAHGIVVVYSCTDLKSFKNINSWLEEIRKYADVDVTKLLIGHKSDASSERVVNQSLAQLMDRKIYTSFISSSLKSYHASEDHNADLKIKITNILSDLPQNILDDESKYVIQDYAESLNMPFLETSAKDSSNVDEAFEILVAEIMKNKLHLPSYKQNASSIDISNAELNET